MSLLERYRRWRGADEAREIEHRETRYHYTVEHLNGKVSEDEGNWGKRDEGFFLILEKDRETWARATTSRDMNYTGAPAFSGTRGYDKVRELEGIQEVHEEEIGEDVFTIVYNDVTKELVDVKKRFVPK